MTDTYMYRFDDEGSEWKEGVFDEEDCIRHAIIEQLEENTNFKSILIAECKEVELPKNSVFRREGIMRCPYHGNINSKVIESRKVKDYNTYEVDA